MKDLTIGIIAHVDAGKTTLSEALLYRTGKIRKLGRVDSRNTFLDTHEIERDRGITVFSKQAIFETGNTRITLIDTPGHTDFAAEAERSISVIDYAVLVISGTEGVQVHTETLWELLSRYSVPTFIFVTKMDLSGFSRNELMEGISSLSDRCIDFSDLEAAYEKAAVADEAMLDEYLATGKISSESLKEAVGKRKIFPCFFGSGLKLNGIDALLSAFETYTEAGKYPAEFSARVFKIAHDVQGNRVTFLKMTGGNISVRQPVRYITDHDEEAEEKITSIRFYSGEKYETADSCPAGRVCAVTGLSGAKIGMGLGAEEHSASPFFEPVLTYRIVLPKDADAKKAFTELKSLEEEEPLLRLVWNERFGEINVQVTGQVQCEILTVLIKNKFGYDVSFGQGKITYKETISAPAVGIGHFEPLRHYSEVHVLLEPLESGSGIVIDNAADEDLLAVSWQRLILSCLEDKRHRGVLCGAPLTDVKITLVAGKAHLKHTSGGDFREASSRAVRQGLMKLRSLGKCVLLEPYYSFRLEVPSECIGTAMADVISRNARFHEAEAKPGYSCLTGTVPVSTSSDYHVRVADYTHGKGKFTVRFEGYLPCHNEKEVIEQTAYDPESDLPNPPHSVFCARGAGFVVPWDQVGDYAHLTPDGRLADGSGQEIKYVSRPVKIDEKELEAIMEREFGPIKRRIYSKTAENSVTPNIKSPKYKKSMYIIDGYNVIFASPELAAIADCDLENARRHLCDILQNYRAFTGKDIIVVFDAYNVKGANERRFEQNGLKIVYTKEGELGDTYIERLIYQIGKDFSVRVVTSDGLIQLQALRTGILRLSAREFWSEITYVDDEINTMLEDLKNEINKEGKE
ncbi:MAG: NYN domain-containing protein [Clostridia bacterium]|nr:NYN domain-containing protein [Clostridia bacterium]